MVIVSARGVSRTEHPQIFGEDVGCEVLELGDFEVIVLNPFSELHPNDALGGERGRRLLAAARGLLIGTPNIGERQKVFAASERREHAVEEVLSRVLVAGAGGACVALTVD